MQERTPRHTPTTDTAFGDDVAVIRREVRDFLFREPQWKLEFDDLVQECAAHWFERSVLYDPARGASRGTFLRSVVRHYLADVKKAQKARQRRAERAALSLDQALDHEDPRGDGLEALVAVASDPSTDPERVLAQHELDRALAAARARLRTDAERRLFDLLRSDTRRPRSRASPRRRARRSIHVLRDSLPSSAPSSTRTSRRGPLKERRS